MKHLVMLVAVVALLLSGCGTAAPQESAQPPAAAQPTATTNPTATPQVEATATLPLIEASPSPEACPVAGDTYRNDVLGIVLDYPAGHLIIEPQYLGDDYSISLVDPERNLLFQVSWLYQEARPLETVIAEYLDQLADLPVERAPVTVAGVEGVMLSPVPGEVANTAIYLTVYGRLFRLLYAREALDDAGHCLLAGLRFFPPTKTLEDLQLTPAADALNEPTPTTALTATAQVVVVTPDAAEADCDASGLSAESPVEIGAPFCVVWLDDFDDERGFRVHLNYDGSGERFIYEVGPDVTQLVVPADHAPRLEESLDECMRRNAFEVQVIALRPETEWRVGSLAANVECGGEGAAPSADVSTWTTYHNPDYGFSFRYPDERWEVVELADYPNLVSLTYHELAIVLRIHFKRAGEELIISEDAAGAAGDRIPKGTIVFIGEAIERTAVVYRGVEREVHYDDARDILRGNLAFAIFLRSNRRFEDQVLPEIVQAEADRILETFELD